MVRIPNSLQEQTQFVLLSMSLTVPSAVFSAQR